MTTTNAIAVEGVRKTFRRDVGKTAQIAVDQLSLVVPQGETTGLVGANGAGKTTTIRLMLGLIRPDAGRVLFFGKPLVARDKRRIGYMPEVGKLPAALTPSEILTDALRVHAPDWLKGKAARTQAVNEKLTDVGLIEHRDKRIAHLSKGMGRRLAFALATIHKPEVLILDEPTSGLDPLGQRDLLDRIEMAKAEGATILLCSHDLAHVMALCESVHILSGGRLAHTSRPKDTLGGAYKIQLSGVTEPALRRVGEAAALTPWLRADQKGFLTELTFDGYAAASRWAEVLLQNGLVVLRFGEATALGASDELLAHFKEEPS